MGFKNSFKTGFGWIMGLYSGLLTIGLISKFSSKSEEDKEEEDKES